MSHFENLDPDFNDTNSQFSDLDSHAQNLHNAGNHTNTPRPTPP